MDITYPCPKIPIIEIIMLVFTLVKMVIITYVISEILKLMPISG
ncbi:hypothetical protein AAKU52_002162 [Pedobacter sp. CG_S7]